MGWFYKQKDSASSAADTTDEHLREQQLLRDLPPQLSDFYTKQTRLNQFKFKEPESSKSRNFRDYVADKPESEVAAINCADFQMEFVNCVTKGSWKEKLSGCDLQSQRNEKCLKLQKLLFWELGLRYTQNIERFNKIVDCGDKMGVKWFEKYDGRDVLDTNIMEDVLEEREKLWK